MLLTPLCPLLPSFTFTIMPFVDTPFILVSLTNVPRKWHVLLSNGAMVSSCAMTKKMWRLFHSCHPELSAFCGTYWMNFRLWQRRNCWHRIFRRLSLATTRVDRLISMDGRTCEELVKNTNEQTDVSRTLSSLPPWEGLYMPKVRRPLRVAGWLAFIIASGQGGFYIWKRKGMHYTLIAHCSDRIRRIRAFHIW